VTASTRADFVAEILVSMPGLAISSDSRCSARLEVMQSTERDPLRRLMLSGIGSSRRIDMAPTLATIVASTLAVVSCWSAQGAAAAVPSFRILQMASMQDGDGQIVELEEVSGLDGQDGFSGLTLTVTNRAGITKTFEFPANLPSAATANKHVMIAAAHYGGGFSADFRPDFNLPLQFLPIDGGTIDFGGIDRWTFDAIPTDGRALKRIGPAAHGRFQNFAGVTAACCGPVFFPDFGSGIDMTVTGVREYYNATLDEYFSSGSQPDLDALDSGRFPGWQAVQEEDWSLFAASSVPFKLGAVTSTPVCRYYIAPAGHFLSASADECDLVARLYPEFVLETRAAFHAILPNPATGACPPYDLVGPILVVFIPVYRLWNQRAGHRFTPSLAARAEMIARGWISEGYGPLGVAMCGFDLE
jgi:hypothetical protein